MPGKIAVEVAYALPEKQYLQRVTLQEGATVEEAIRASGLLELRTDIDLTKNKVGIYSRPAKLSDIVHDGDRSFCKGVTRAMRGRSLNVSAASVLAYTPWLRFTPSKMPSVLKCRTTPISSATLCWQRSGATIIWCTSISLPGWIGSMC